MILGISHIVLGSTNLVRDRQGLESIGWTTLFEQRGLKTHPGKIPFMRSASHEQHLVFMQPCSGISVELIHYADSLVDASPTPLQIMLPGEASKTALTNFTCELEFSTRAPIPSLITHRVTDMARAQHFWEKGIGFIPMRNRNNSTGSFRLEYKSILPQWRAMLDLVSYSGEECPSVIDGPGYRCLSIVCSDLRKDSARALNAGASSTTGPQEIVVNGRHLHIEIIAAPDGAMIELLQVTK